MLVKRRLRVTENQQIVGHFRGKYTKSITCTRCDNYRQLSTYTKKYRKLNLTLTQTVTLPVSYDLGLGVQSYCQGQFSVVFDNYHKPTCTGNYNRTYKQEKTCKNKYYYSRKPVLLRGRPPPLHYCHHFQLRFIFLEITTIETGSSKGPSKKHIGGPLT